MKILTILITSALITLSATVSANNDTESTTKKLNDVLVATFKSSPDSVAESLIPGLYRVMYGTEVVYLSADGQYFISGDLLDLKTRKNYSELAKRSVRKKMLAATETNPVVFKAKDEKHVLRVFTDVDCGYCAKFHREMEQINDKGITIEYLAFPRAGIDSSSYNKIVNVWCADNQQDAMTKAKMRQPVEAKKCDNPVKQQYELGQAMGVNGTPALLTESGQLIPGYVPADRLAAMLDEDKASTVLSQ